MAIKRHGLARRIEGVVRREASVRECEDLGVVDRACLDLDATVQDADLIILCTPISQMGPLTRRMAPHLKPGALITDVGSVKECVVNELTPLARSANAFFIGSHPMAGGEKTGVNAARAELFENAVCAITPTDDSQTEMVTRIENLWASIGARPLMMAPKFHDELVARSSHLPHIIASELVNFVLHPDRPKEQRTLCASGFRDTTRIASGDAGMWRDIAIANRHHLAPALQTLIENLQAIQSALADADADTIERCLRTANNRRERWRRALQTNQGH